MVFHGPQDANCSATSAAATMSTPSPTSGTSTSAVQNAPGCHAAVRQSLEAAGLSDEVISVIARSWREGTNKQYKSYLQRWVDFRNQTNSDILSAPVNDFLQFLCNVYPSSDLGYSAMNTARSAVSTVLVIYGAPAGQHPLVYRFLKGIYNQKPALPRNSVTWDISILLNFLRKLSPAKMLDLKQLSLKLLMLCLVLSGQRGQTMHLLDLRNMSLTSSRVSFVIGDLAKTSKPGNHVEELSYLAYAPDRRLCALTVLSCYLERTRNIRGSETRLFLTLRQPHTAASRDILRRWEKSALAEAGINMGIFKPHSVRSTSTSFAAQTRLSLDTILRTAGWFHETTFSKYYHMPVKYNFGHHISTHAK